MSRVITAMPTHPLTPRAAVVSLGPAMQAIVALNAIDALGTWLVLHGGGHEVNPLMAAVILRFGWYWFLVAKAVTTATVLIALVILARLGTRTPGVMALARWCAGTAIAWQVGIALGHSVALVTLIAQAHH